jgi:hypothetical protein
MPSKKTSLSDRMRMKKKALKSDSKDEAKNIKSAISSHLASKQKDAEDKGNSLAARIKAKAEAIQDEDDDGDELSEEESAALQSSVASAKSRYADLITRVKMTSIVRETTSLGNQIEGLPEKIEEIRRRGYKFRSYLEGKIEVMADRWDEINERVEKWLEEESEELDDELAKCERYNSRIGNKITSKTEALLESFNAVLDDMETQVAASEEKIKALYDEVRGEVSKTNSQLSQVAKHLDWLDEANLNLNAGEGL